MEVCSRGKEEKRPGARRLGCMCEDIDTRERGLERAKIYVVAEIFNPSTPAVRSTVVRDYDLKFKYRRAIFFGVLC